MKGIVFTEFIEMCEKTHGLLFTNEVIIESDLESNGSYTSVGTYDHKEIFKLVRVLSEKTNIPEKDLFVEFGKYLFTQFFNYYPEFFKEISDPFIMLESVDQHIHKEVLKIYPDAQLPEFKCITKNDKLEMIYKSPRKMADFALGLIHGCMTHFKTDFTIETITDINGDTHFIITKE